MVIPLSTYYTRRVLYLKLLWCREFISKKVLIMELLIVLCQFHIGDIFLTDKCVLSRIPFLQRECRRIFLSVILKPANFDNSYRGYFKYSFPRSSASSIICTTFDYNDLLHWKTLYVCCSFAMHSMCIFMLIIVDKHKLSF